MMQFLPVLILALIIFALWFWHHQHKKKHGLKGAMGWILFFNLGNVLGSLGYAFKNINDTQGTLFEIPSTILNLLLGVVNFYITYLTIWRQGDPSTPSKVIKLLWVREPIIGAILYIMPIIYFQILKAHSPFNLPLYPLWVIYVYPLWTDVIGPILGAMIWILYFRNAERVRNMYALSEAINNNYVRKIVGICFLTALISLAMGFADTRIERIYSQQASIQSNATK